MHRLSAIPQAPVDNFYHGHSLTMNKWKAKNQFLDLFVLWVDTYGETLLFWIQSNRPLIFCADPKILKGVSTDLKQFKKFDGLPNRSLYGQRLVGKQSILSGNGLKWAVKRKVMIQFFAKTNLNTLFEACKPHMEGRELNRWKSLVQKGTTIELHDQLGILFSSYLQVLGMGDMMSPELIAENVFKILDALPKQLSSRFSFMYSQQKTDCVQMILKMRKSILDVVKEKSEEMQRNGSEIGPTDMLGYLVEANKTRDGEILQSEAEANEFIVDDVMTVCLVMDNLVKQISSLFILLNDVPEVQVKNTTFKFLHGIN